MENIAATLRSDGAAHWRQIALDVGARSWGPGRFRRALRAATRAGMIRSLGRGLYDAAPTPIPRRDEAGRTN